MTEVSGRKVWQDEADAHGLRPESITVRLYADGTLVNATPTWRKDGNVWTYSFGERPKLNAAGNEISYTVTEDPVDDYTTDITGTTITNTLIPREPKETAELKGTKTWKDDNDAAGKRPASITVYLLRDDVEISRKSVTAEDGWRYSFGELPLDDGYGHEYVYTVREDGVAGYFQHMDGLDLVNSMLPTSDTPDDDTPDDDTPKGGDVPKRDVTHKRVIRKFSSMDEEEFEDILDILDYGTPLWGTLLGTGDETPAYPWVFGGIGLLAVALLIFGRKRRTGEE